ncbi:VacJ family lipoprotein [Acidisphaera sp. L21]|jgi:phospholipid-binding lipoprotein MlaA|uniref:MlaA family lipoprotein n=1 Tax=Acidisphaera sp. L21 TaxID=1641851 RepID=UPI00131E431F|nr:VacJ family lipoprotein [Acidisphaera sp. L21]
MRTSLLRSLLAVAAVWAVSACATKPPASDAAATAEYRDNNDPLEPTNRVVYAFNDGLDTYVLAPVARAYRWALPDVVRQPIHNALLNMTTPVILINDVVQTKPRRAGDTFMRFVINTTAGVGGLFDVAAKVGYPYHDADFGETMALWGVPEGPFLFLPVFGPSNPRDAVGYGVDVAFDPLTYVPSGHGLRTFAAVRTGVAAVDARSQVLDEVDSVKKTALDPYATFRSLYRQNRESTIDKVRTEDRATVPNWYAK